MSEAIGTVIGRLLDKRELPDRVRVCRTYSEASPLVAGQRWTWDEQARGYTCPERPDLVALAFEIRRGLGVRFVAEPYQLTLPVEPARAA
jgi:hypothetical protein